MKIANRLIAIAVSAVALGTMAYGRTEVLEAKIPFAFRTAQGTLPAGSYAVTRNYGGLTGVIWVQNTVTHKGLVVMGLSSETKASDATGLRFYCSDGCELIAVRSRGNVIALRANRKLRSETAIIEIPLTAVATGN